MRECMDEELRDLLPELARGALEGERRAALLAHLDGCAACAAELELVREARAVLAPVPAIDIARIVAALPSPGESPALRVERGGSRPEPRATRWTAWRVAAGILVVGTAGALALRQPAERTTPREQSSAPVAAPAPAPPGPAGRSAPGVTRPAGPASAIASGAAPAPAQLTLVGGTTELSDAALRALLEEIDALDAVPLAEPADEASLVEEG